MSPASAAAVDTEQPDVVIPRSDAPHTDRPDVVIPSEASPVTPLAVIPSEASEASRVEGSGRAGG